MNTNRHNPYQAEPLLAQLNTAETALRLTLAHQGIEPGVRAHLERALAHIHESVIGIARARHFRSVDDLVNDLVQFARRCEEAEEPAVAGDQTKSSPS